jgi:DNA-binding transcriptional LysR family regulator
MIQPGCNEIHCRFLRNVRQCHDNAQYLCKIRTNTAATCVDSLLDASNIIMEALTLYALLPEMAVFARVVETGNFSVAARQLGSTPSTISRQIKKLEDTLSTRLFERTTRELRVTESGEQIYRYSRDIVSAALSAVDAAGNLAGSPRGRVNVSAPTAFARTVIHPLVANFLRRYPDVDLRLFFTDDDVEPVAGHLDLVIRLTKSPPAGLAGRPLRTVHWMLCASKAYLDKRGMPQHPSDLSAHDCICLGEKPDDNRWRFRRRILNGEHTAQADTHLVEVSGRYTVNSAGARVEAATEGFGIASLPAFVAEAAVAKGDLVEVLNDWEFEVNAYVGKVWLLYPPNRFLPPKVRVLIDYLVACLAQGEAAAER